MGIQVSIMHASGFQRPVTSVVLCVWLLAQAVAQDAENVSCVLPKRAYENLTKDQLQDLERVRTLARAGDLEESIRFIEENRNRLQLSDVDYASMVCEFADLPLQRATDIPVRERLLRKLVDEHQGSLIEKLALVQLLKLARSTQYLHWSEFSIEVEPIVEDCLELFTDQDFSNSYHLANGVARSLLKQARWTDALNVLESFRMPNGCATGIPEWLGVSKAVCYLHLRQPKKAFEHLLPLTRTAVGAMLTFECFRQCDELPKLAALLQDQRVSQWNPSYLAQMLKIEQTDDPDQLLKFVTDEPPPGKAFLGVPEIKAAAVNRMAALGRVSVKPILVVLDGWNSNPARAGIEPRQWIYATLERNPSPEAKQLLESHRDGVMFRTLKEKAPEFERVGWGVKDWRLGWPAMTPDQLPDKLWIKDRLAPSSGYGGEGVTAELGDQ